MSKLILVVPAGRRSAGRGVLLGRDGRVRLAPFRVLATASASAASNHGNARLDWRRPFGHTPTGSYVVAGALPPEATSASPSDGLGALVLAPVAGNALEALRAGRSRFLLHGGPTDAEGRLRRTFGGLRVSNPDLASLLRALNEANADGDPVSSVEVDETSTPAWQTDESDHIPPSSRGSRRQKKAVEAGRVSVPRSLLASAGFGPAGGSKTKRAPQAAAPGRRAFLAVALFALGAMACGGSEVAGGGDATGASEAGQDGGGAGGGYEGGLQVAEGGFQFPDGGPQNNDAGDAGTLPDGGVGEGGFVGEGGVVGEGGTTGGTGSDTTTTGSDTTTGATTTGTTTDTTGTTTGTTGTTTGVDTTTTGIGPTTTGVDTTTTGSDTTTTGVDTTTTGIDTTTTGIDTTTTGIDTTTTDIDTTTTGADTTTTGADTTTTGGDDTTSFVRRHHRRRRRPPTDEGSGL